MSDMPTGRHCSAVHQDDTLWRLVAHHVWPKELLRVGSPGQREPAGDQGRHDLEEAYVTFRELVLDRNSRFSGWRRSSPVSCSSSSPVSASHLLSELPTL